LIEVSMPALSSENKDFEVLECWLNYANVLDSSLDKVGERRAIQRLDNVPADQEVDSIISQQRNRIIAAEALEKASAEAERGRLEEGKMLLEEALKQMEARTASLNSETAKIGMVALMSDIRECKETLKSRQEYKNRGRMRMKAKVQTHWLQRSNDVDLQEDAISREMNDFNISCSSNFVGSAGDSVARGYRSRKKTTMLNKAFAFSKKSDNNK